METKGNNEEKQVMIQIMSTVIQESTFIGGFCFAVLAVGPNNSGDFPSYFLGTLFLTVLMEIYVLIMASTLTRRLLLPEERTGRKLPRGLNIAYIATWWCHMIGITLFLISVLMLGANSFPRVSESYFKGFIIIGTIISAATIVSFIVAHF